MKNSSEEESTTTEEELEELVAEQLRELAWTNNYPLHPSIALWSFFEGLRETKNSVVIDDMKKTITVRAVRPLIEERHVLKTTLSFGDILSGWHSGPEGTPRKLYDSLYKVYDRMGSDLQTLKEQDLWYDMRSNSARTAMDAMDKHLLTFFRKYHENALLPANGRVPELKQPTLFNEVMKEYPLEIHKKAKLSKAQCGPNPEMMVDEDFSFDALNRNYYPSEATMREYFWGHYLEKLSEEKGYQLYRRGNSLLQLISQGGRALRNGFEIFEP
jgi:hypothetical protein